MQQVRAKKHLGQHFLKDERIAKEIADSLSGEYPCVLEIGPGMGVLTKYLIVDPKVKEFKVVEIDKESVDFLNSNFPSLCDNIFSVGFSENEPRKFISLPLLYYWKFPL